jgi:hypothetical protein
MNEQLIKDIYDRVVAMQGETAALKETMPSEARILELVKQHIDGLEDNDPIVKKMRGWGQPDARLSGSKYSRWGLTAGDIEYLYDIQNSLRGMPRLGGGTYQGPSEELDKAFRAVSDAYYLTDEEARKIDRNAIDDVFPRIPKDQFRQWSAARQRAYMTGRQQAMRAATMDTGQSGFGSQLVGAQYVGDIWDAAFQDARVMQLLNTFEMTAPTAYLPVAVDMPEPMYVSESTSDVLATAQYPTVRTGSNRVQVDAKKFVIHQVWSGEMEEDSIVPLIPFYRLQAARALAFFGDATIINGDTVTSANTNINLIDGTPGSTKYYLAWNGMRKVGLIDNTANSKDAAGPITLALLRGAKQRMIDLSRNVDWGHPNDLNDLVYLADPQTADRIATLDEVLQAKIERANQADLLNGQVTSFVGNPVISTLAVPLSNSSGMVSATGGNNTKGSIVTFNRGGYVIGWRRRVRIETERIIGSDQTRLVYSYRLGLGRYTPNGNVNAQEHSDTTYDIDLS